jgi:DnaK suppressor protein
MDSERMRDTRQLLTSEYENLIKGINRNGRAAEEIKLENTEDEGDLAVISHDKAVLYNLQEGGFARLRLIQEAIKAVDRGQYGQCIHCGNDIAQKRLEAVPWTALCIDCQTEAEAERASELQPDLETETIEL